MADKYLLEDASGGYLLEDSSGYLILDTPNTAAELLTDNFDDNSRDITKWTLFGTNTTAAEVNGHLEITTSTTGSGYAGYDSLNPVSLVGSRASVQIIAAGDQTLAHLEIPFSVILDSNNRYFFLISGNVVGFYQTIAGVQTKLGQVTYSATSHQYFRISESNGTIYWGLSADGITWTIPQTAPAAFPMSAVFIELSAGCWGVDATATTVKYDNFNILTASGAGTVVQSAKFAPGGTAKLVHVNLNLVPTVGNVLVAFVSNYAQYYLATPPGWTLLETSAASLDFDMVSIFARTVVTGDTTGYSWAVNGTDYCSAVVMEVQGKLTGNQHATAVAGTASASMVTPSLTPAVGDTLIGVVAPDSNDQTDGAPSGWTFDQNASPAFHPTVVAHKTATSATSTSATFTTIASSSRYASGLVVIPAVGTPPPPATSNGAFFSFF